MAHSMLGVASETVFVECRAFVFYYNTNIQQWCDVGKTGIYSRVQLLCSRPSGSTGIYRIFARLETSGMITLNISLTANIVYNVVDQTWHEIRSDPRSIYGLRISPESDGIKFSIIVQNTLRSLQANPGPVPSNHSPTGPPPSPMVAWGVHPNAPMTTTPMAVPSPVRKIPPDGPVNLEARRSQRRRDQEAQIDAQCFRLSNAIQTGNISQSTEIVKTLAAQKLYLSIKLKNPAFVTMDPGEETINLKVVVEDKESSGGAFSIKVLPTATIERLQQEVFDRYGFPIQVQKWIVSKKIPQPKETLQELGVTQSGTTVFLYLLSGKSVGLRRSDAEKVARGTATPACFPVITESDTSNATDRIPPVTTATSVPSLVNQNGALLVARSEPILLANPSPPPSVIVQRNVNSPAPGPAFAMPRHISEIRNILGQQMGNQAAVGQTLQNTVVNNLLSAEPVEQVAAGCDEPLGWQCPRCTLINPPTRPGCEACSAARPADYVVPTGTHVDDRERNRIAEEQRSEALFREAEQRRQAEEQAARDQNFVALLQTAQKNLIPNTEEFDCGICFVPVEPGEGVTLRECLHSFCRDCLSEHIRHAADPEVQCPHQDDDYACHAMITGQEIKALLSPEDFNKFLNRSLATAESQAVNSFHCKSPNCAGWCVYDDNVNTFHCPVCNQPNCLTCKAIHADMNCREYQDDLKRRADNDDAAKQTQLFLEGMVKSGEAMHCPMCRIILLKKDGCDWMRCSMCRMEICWATRGPRWGPEGTGDISGGCKCRVGGKKCHPKCRNCH